MLRRPFPGPLHRYKVWICRRRLSRSPQLDEIFHDQLVPTKEPNPFSVWQLVLDALTVIERCEPEVVRCEPRRDGVPAGSKQMSRMGVDIQKAKSPVGFSTRDTSGIVACGDAKTVAPWSQNTISNASRRNGKLSASPCTSDTLRDRPRAWVSCRSDRSRPMAHAPA